IAGGACLAPRQRFFTGLAAASLIYALGSHTPAFRLIFDLVPGISLYRRPADACFILVVAIAMLAGGSLDVLIRQGIG
ncbi:hypothetical protein, partial [Acinetobacter baumannii]|uniref:hypothetical protein n=1 Tax=Acinetobacter baumannii TaxID=470 RepID=UPI0013D00FAE